MLGLIRQHAPSVMTLNVLLAACGAPADSPAGGDSDSPPARDWRDEVVYQLLTDRFANGDPQNDDGVDPSDARAYHGGDWQGVIDHLDYIEGLGATAIWISPVARNIDAPASSSAGYHGFWPSALDAPNPHFGTGADLQALVDACHERHIKVIADLVLNHLGPVAYYDRDEDGVFDGGPELAPPFDGEGIATTGGARPAPLVFFDPDAVSPALLRDPSVYNRRGQIVDFGDPVQARTGDFQGGLRDLDTTRPDVRAALLEVTLGWLDDAGFDGIRYDAAKHIEEDFWDSFLAGVRDHDRDDPAFDDGLLQVAEVFDGNPAALRPFTSPGRFDGMLDFSVKYRVYDDVFAAGGPTTGIESWHIEKETTFADSGQPGGVGTPVRRTLLAFLDNHDVPRLRNFASAGAVHAALAHLLTSDGIPVLYYGTEQDLSGGADPANREDLWEAGYAQDGATYGWIARLSEVGSPGTELEFAL